MKDGGPAFPREFEDTHYLEKIESGDPGDPPNWVNHRKFIAKDGMSLRDYFAAHEISYPTSGFVQARCGNYVTSWMDLQGVELAECLSAWRYQMADAMLAERDK